MDQKILDNGLMGSLHYTYMVFSSFKRCVVNTALARVNKAVYSSFGEVDEIAETVKLLIR